MKWYHAVMIGALGASCLLQSLVVARLDDALEIFKETTSISSKSTVENKVQQKNYEELIKRTMLLNEICPTRQEIPACEEWCQIIDCKE